MKTTINSLTTAWFEPGFAVVQELPLETIAILIYEKTFFLNWSLNLWSFHAT